LPALVDISTTDGWMGRPTPARRRLRARISALKPVRTATCSTCSWPACCCAWRNWWTVAGLPHPQHAIDHGTAPLDRAHYRIRTERVAADKHADYGMALFSALSAGVALMSYWCRIALGWEGGGNAR
jgi:hypothetical protein